MRLWWPFRRNEGQVRQREQVEQSVQRISEDGRRRVDEAQAQLTEAAESVKVAIGTRVAEASQLREALLTLIDRKSGGIFDVRKQDR